jgi:hypothetical protein
MTSPRWTPPPPPPEQQPPSGYQQAYGPPAGYPQQPHPQVPQQWQHPTKAPVDLPAPKRKPRWWIPISILSGLIVVGVLAATVTAGGAGDSGRSAAETQFVSALRSSANGEFKGFDDATLVAIGGGICAKPQGETFVSVAASVASDRRVSQAAAEVAVRLATQNLCSTRSWPGTGAPSSSTTYVAQAPATTPAPPVVATPAKAITAREWQLIAKNPGGHVGERIVVYGQVTQFDAATGTTGFRANVDGVAHKVSYGYADYETNTVLAAASSSLLADVVEKDLFRAEVTVLGSYTYDTAIGGSSTAPKLQVTAIKVTGTAK